MHHTEIRPKSPFPYFESREADLLNERNTKNLFRDNIHFSSPNTSYLNKTNAERDENSSPYLDSLAALDTKVALESNTRFSFENQRNAPEKTLDLTSTANLILNDPYFDINDTIKSQNEISNGDIGENEEAKQRFLAYINDLKSLYLDETLNDKQLENRSRKFKLMENFFSNENFEQYWHLDDKDCLMYKSIKTMVKFSYYIDLFLKYPNEISKGIKYPIFFKELFLGKILSNKERFSPVFHQAPSVKRKDTDAVSKFILLKKQQVQKLKKIYRLIGKVKNDQESLDMKKKFKHRINQLQKEYHDIQRKSDMIHSDMLFKTLAGYEDSPKDIEKDISRMFRNLTKTYSHK